MQNLIPPRNKTIKYNDNDLTKISYIIPVYLHTLKRVNCCVIITMFVTYIIKNTKTERNITKKYISFIDQLFVTKEIKYMA